MFSALRLTGWCGCDKAQVWRLMFITQSGGCISHNPSLIVLPEEHKHHFLRRTKAHACGTGSSFTSPTSLAKKNPTWPTMHQQTHLVINLHHRYNYWWKTFKPFYLRGFYSKINPAISLVSSALSVHKTGNRLHFSKSHCTEVCPRHEAGCHYI